MLRLDRVRDYGTYYRRPDGTELALSVGVSVIQDREGEPEAVVLIARDVTEHRRAEEEVLRLNAGLEQRVGERTAQLQEANEYLQKEIAERRRAEEERSRLLVLEQAARAEAEGAVRAREVLLSVVSHDLRNLLTAVRGSTRLLQRMAPADPLLQTTLKRVDEASTRMNSMINELLDFSQLQAGQPLDLYRQKVDLVALARQVADYHRQDTDRHEITVVSEGPSLAGLWDPPRLERVLDNLLTNAIKYSPRGGQIAVEIRSDGEGEGRCAVLVVRDRGVGIPAGDLPHVFDWFHRAANVSGRIKGSGIGLASVRQVVEQHGGTVEVESEVNQGTTFTVRLPVHVAGATQPGRHSVPD
jgi:signal transduction histidine kinase